MQQVYGVNSESLCSEREICAKRGEVAGIGGLQIQLRTNALVGVLEERARKFELEALNSFPGGIASGFQELLGENQSERIKNLFLVEKSPQTN